MQFRNQQFLIKICLLIVLASEFLPRNSSVWSSCDESLRAGGVTGEDPARRTTTEKVRVSMKLVAIKMVEIE